MKWILEPGKIKRIHINRHKMVKNTREGCNEPIITVKTSCGNLYGHKVEIDGPSTVEYLPNKPLSCGAKCWITTKAGLTITSEESIDERPIRDHPTTEIKAPGLPI
jgi:hypothetical protein